MFMVSNIESNITSNIGGNIESNIAGSVAANISGKILMLSASVLDNPIYLWKQSWFSNNTNLKKEEEEKKIYIYI